MRDSQKNILIAVISGIVACIVCVGVMFTFPTNKSNLKGNETKLPNNQEEINLGDAGYCGPRSGVPSYVCSGISDEVTCNETGGCYWNIIPTPVITCTNPTYTGAIQNIATCTNGTLSGHKHIDAGMYDVSCSGTGGNVTKKCYIARADGSITGAPASITLKVGQTRTLSGITGTGTISYSIGSGSSISLSGMMITGVAVGNSVIVVTTAETNNYNTRFKYITVAVEAPTCEDYDELENCPSTCRWYNNGCHSCQYGEYFNGTSCELCHAGHECPDGINMVACPPGKYSEAGGQVGCASCANLDDGIVRVQPASGQTSCIRCEGDKIANADHTQCVANATNCEEGQYSANGECHDCPPGKYCNGTGAIDCKRGTYAAVTGKRTNCSPCNGTNQYQDQYGQTQCKTCVGEVNEDHTACTPTCSSKTTQSDCGTLEGCAWVNDQCIYKPACSTFNDKTKCEARSDCAWDTTWTTYCHNKPNTVVSVTASTNNVYVAVDYPVEVTFTATDANGQPINVSWSAGTNSVTKNCGTISSTCTYTFNSHGCGTYSFQATGTDVGGGSATSKKVSATTYTTWGNGSNRTSKTRPTEKTRESLKYKVGCEAIENIRENNGQYTYTAYNRCCGGGTSTYNFCCVKNDGSGHSWLTGQASKTCPEGYTIDNTKNASTCTKTFACYMDSDNQPHWTSDPQPSWVVVSKPEQECKDQEACFEDPTGQRFWGKHYDMIAQGYILITSIKDEDSCKNPSDDDACYINNEDISDYRWSKTPLTGYTKADGIDNPKECQPEACYIEKDKNEFAFGKYKDNDKYIPVYKTIEVDGEYKDVLIIDKNECTTEVPVGPTDFDVAKLVYVFMAILMACGIAFIYYSSVAKKQNQ